MKNFRLIPYLYLFVAILFTYDGITKYLNNEDYYIQIMMVAIAVFMFVFRLKTRNKHNK